jgi:hypothetical protein
LGFVLGINGDLVVAEKNGDLSQDVVVTQLAKAFIGRRNGRFVGRGLLLFDLKLLLLLLNFLLVCLNLLLILLNLLLRRSQAGLDVTLSATSWWWSLMVPLTSTDNPGTRAVMLRCFLRKSPSGSFTCVVGVRTTVTVSPPCVRTVIVAPLRPLITPFTWLLCAVAMPQSNRTAATARPTRNGVFTFVLFINPSFSCVFCPWQR